MDRHDIDRWPHTDDGPSVPSESGGQEPDEDSAEDVRPELAGIDDQLERAGMTSPAHEVSRQPDEILAEALSEALGRVGLYRADEIDVAMLQELPEPVLEKLTPKTAEVLYFETYRRSRKWLGNEHITPHRVFSIARAW